MKAAKRIFSIILSAFAVGILCYLIGFLTNLLKAILSARRGVRFKMPSADFVKSFVAVFDFNYSKYVIGLFAVITIIVLILIIKGKIQNRNRDERNFTVSDKGTYGTARYLQEKEAKKLVTADGSNSLLTVTKEITNSENGIILGKYPNGDIVLKNVIEKENMNIFVCGAPGSGKSYMFVRPYLVQSIRRNESFICTDPSGELLESVGGYAKQQGYKVKVFNLVNPEHSDSWNVTSEVGTDQLLAQICVTTIINNTLNGGKTDPFWDNGEQNLLKALLLYINSDAYTGDKSLGGLYKLLAASDFTQNTLACLKSLDDNHPAKLPYNIYAQATEAVQQSYASGLATRLQIFQSEEIRNMVAFDGIDLTAPGKEKCAYFIIMSDQDSTYELLSSLFFSFLFIKLADFGKTQPNQRMPVRVNVVLDELPSIGKIPDLGRKLATVRKYGVNVVPIIQLISQLDNRYSEAERDEIIGCCDTQIWLGSNDATSANILSQRSGTMTVDVSSKSESLTDTGSQMTSSIGKRAVLNMDEVMRIPLDEQIIVLRGQNIIKLKKFKFHEHPDFKQVKDAPSITLAEYKAKNSELYEKKNTKYEALETKAGKENNTESKKPESRKKTPGLTIN